MSFQQKKKNLDLGRMRRWHKKEFLSERIPQMSSKNFLVDISCHTGRRSECEKKATINL
jgi:hypothetical protein